jgi:hypothetical protein
MKASPWSRAAHQRLTPSPTAVRSGLCPPILRRVCRLASFILDKLPAFNSAQRRRLAVDRRSCCLISRVRLHFSCTTTSPPLTRRRSFLGHTSSLVRLAEVPLFLEPRPRLCLRQSQSAHVFTCRVSAVTPVSASLPRGLPRLTSSRRNRQDVERKQ